MLGFFGPLFCCRGQSDARVVGVLLDDPPAPSDMPLSTGIKFRSVKVWVTTDSVVSARWAPVWKAEDPMLKAGWESVVTSIES